MPLRDLIELKIFWVPTAKVHVWEDTHPSNVKAVKDNPRLEPGHCKHSNKEYVSHPRLTSSSCRLPSRSCSARTAPPRALREEVGALGELLGASRCRHWCLQSGRTPQEELNPGPLS